MAKIGIDLGTTNCVVAHFVGPNAETIPVAGSPTMPSVVSVDQQERVIIGTQAKNRAIAFPQRTIVASKRRIGDGTTTYTIGKSTFTPIDVAKLLLKELKKAAEDFLGEPVDGAVVTVPAYFNLNQKTDTGEAIREAGIELIHLLTEPEAAAISYAIDRKVNQTLMVYDLGGGTFDITILKVVHDEFRTIAINGDTRLGGYDFDRDLTRFLAEHIEGCNEEDRAALIAYLNSEGSGSAVEDALAPIAAQRLIEQAERTKIELGGVDNTEVLISDIIGGSLQLTVDQNDLKRIIKPYIENTIALCKETLFQADLTAADIDKILLVGGSTKLRFVQEMLSEAIKPPWVSTKVDEAVALGAAIVAAATGIEGSGKEGMTGTLPAMAGTLPKTITLKPITSHDLGVLVEEDGDDDFFSVILPKGSEIPATVTSLYKTASDDQRQVQVLVFQGESKSCTDNEFIGGFILDGIPPLPQGEAKIDVRFHLSKNDLLEVSATCGDANQTVQLNPTRIGDMATFLNATSKSAEVVFLIDTSGSMSGELQAVKNGVQQFADSIDEGGVQCNVGVMTFAISSNYKWKTIPPMNAGDLVRNSDFQSLKIGQLGYGGCYIGDHDSIRVIGALCDTFRPDREKVAVLISDETCASPDKADLIAIQNLLSANRVKLFVLGVQNSGSHRTLAEATGGSFWDISKVRKGTNVDFDEVLDSIAAEICGLVAVRS
ncbi:MAG TPA: Hsp70 family protein [Fimbriimonadaceae bacterium]|jgi:molecular chaperone DnaK